MFSNELLRSLGPILFTTEKIRSHYATFVKSSLVPQWTAQVDPIVTLIDFRDYAEDTFAFSCAEFKIDGKFSVTVDNLVKALKMTTDSAKRRVMTVAFLEENVLGLQSSITNNVQSPDFLNFAIQRELLEYFDLAFGIGKIRPVLKCSVETIEAVIKQIDSTPLNLDKLEQYKKSLGVTSLWPVVALLTAHSMGEVEELFLHVPMPRVFGAPSCVRNSLSKIDKDVTVVGNSGILIDNAVIAGTNSLCWKTSQGWITKECSVASMVAVLPGTRAVWCLDPLTMQAAIYSFDPFKILLEFELPVDDKKPNWIDCQRDSEGTLVLMWGNINPLTGALHAQNVTGIDEEALFSDSEFVLQKVTDVPFRRRLGYKIDWRDHGNLISVHHRVIDIPGVDRRWANNYDIVFADRILMTLEIEARPIDAVFGTPKQMLLLSPLSAMQTLQLWSFDNGSYSLANTSRLPKCPKGQWTSLSAIVN